MATSSQLRPSLVLRLPRHALFRRDAINRLGVTWQARRVFAFKCDELEFARALLNRRSNLWLWRTSQRAFAGDFIAVDLSSNDRPRRRAFVLELKRGGMLRVSDPTSIQLRNAPAAMRELADCGVVAEETRLQAITGDAAAILRFLSAS